MNDLEVRLGKQIAQKFGEDAVRMPGTPRYDRNGRNVDIYDVKLGASLEILNFQHPDNTTKLALSNVIAYIFFIIKSFFLKLHSNSLFNE